MTTNWRCDTMSLMWVSRDTMSFDVRPVLMKLMRTVQMYSNSEIWVLIVWWPNSWDCNRLSNNKSWFLMLWWRYSPSVCTDLSNTLTWVLMVWWRNSWNLQKITPTHQNLSANVMVMKLFGLRRLSYSDSSGDVMVTKLFELQQIIKHWN